MVVGLPRYRVPERLEGDGRCTGAGRSRTGPGSAAHRDAARRFARRGPNLDTGCTAVCLTRAFTCASDDR